MIKLKELSIMESTEQLKLLPQGKLLINTINAHSYNTALKDPLFANYYKSIFPAWEQSCQSTTNRDLPR